MVLQVSHPPTHLPPSIAGFLSSVLKHLQKDPEEVAVTVLTVVKEKVCDCDHGVNGTYS